MNVTIEKRALETLLFAILSCQCPVTEETERALFTEFRATPPEDDMALSPFLAIADRNPEKTPLHLFLEFCSFNQPDPYHFTVTHDDAVRYFSSRYHFNRIVASIDPLTITHPPGHLIGHMLIPVKLENTGLTAEVRLGGKAVHFKNLFQPPEIMVSPGAWLGLHLGMIITSLSDEQAKMAQAHVSLIDEIAGLAGWTDEIDYTRYQSFGDYRAYVMARYKRHF